MIVYLIFFITLINLYSSQTKFLVTLSLYSLDQMAPCLKVISDLLDVSGFATNISEEKLKQDYIATTFFTCNIKMILYAIPTRTTWPLLEPSRSYFLMS